MIIKKQYKKKLKLESEELADPYALSENEWCDYITKWPSVEYGDIYGVKRPLYKGVSESIQVT